MLDELTAENIAMGMRKEHPGYAVLHAMRIQENGRSWDQRLICTTRKLGRLWFRYSVEEISERRLLDGKGRKTPDAHFIATV